MTETKTRHYSGNKIVVPAGKTVEEHVRSGMDMEVDEPRGEVIAGRLEIGVVTYRRVATMIALLESGELSQEDLLLVMTALALVNETRLIGDAWASVEHLAEKMFGSGSDSNPREVRRLRRMERFEKSFGIIKQSCEAATEIELPYLSPERIKRVRSEIREARRALLLLDVKLKEMHG